MSLDEIRRSRHLARIISAASLALVVALLPASGAETDAGELALVGRIRQNLLVRAKTESPGRALAGYRETIPNTTVSFQMLPIPAGKFKLGSPASEPGRSADEGPQVDLSLPAFWMEQTEVTWDEYELFMFESAAESAAKDAADAVSHPTKPYVEMSFGMGRRGFPAISMTQHAANKYCEWLSAKTGKFYRLPTEAEWEYAARAGTRAAYFFGNRADHLSEYAWFNASAYHQVGLLKPNPWGLKDIYGNVAEWTLDQYLPDGYRVLAAMHADSPWIKSTQPYPQSVRGGSWSDTDPLRLRSAARQKSDPAWKMLDPQIPKSIWYHTNAPWIGFRIVRQREIPAVAALYADWNNGVAIDP